MCEYALKYMNINMHMPECTQSGDQHMRITINATKGKKTPSSQENMTSGLGGNPTFQLGQINYLAKVTTCNKEGAF